MKKEVKKETIRNKKMKLYVYTQYIHQPSMQAL